MSLRRGDRTKRAQKHHNSSAYRNDLHDTSRRTKDINSMTVSGVCQRCKETIEWKIKYGKYKPLSAPKRCTVCHEKVVRFAYHTMCTKCSAQRGVCSKCGNGGEVERDAVLSPADRAREEERLRQSLKDMREREKRAFVRELGKEHGSRPRDRGVGNEPGQIADRSQSRGSGLSVDLVSGNGVCDLVNDIDDSAEMAVCVAVGGGCETDEMTDGVLCTKTRRDGFDSELVLQNAEEEQSDHEKYVVPQRAYVVTNLAPGLAGSR